jgi:hypothetical protein
MRDSRGIPWLDPTNRIFLEMRNKPTFLGRSLFPYIGRTRTKCARASIGYLQKRARRRSSPGNRRVFLSRFGDHAYDRDQRGAGLDPRLGIRPGGEGGTAGALAAVGNAIVDALKEFGVEHIELPFERQPGATRLSYASPRYA